MGGAIPPCVCLDGVDRDNLLRYQYKIAVPNCCVTSCDVDVATATTTTTTNNYVNIRTESPVCTDVSLYAAPKCVRVP